jgi:ATP/maltotriose-dependent transcriptional regulator MalT
MGLALTAVDVAALERRTEGWAAALQLAALSLQGRHDSWLLHCIVVPGGRRDRLRGDRA